MQNKSILLLFDEIDTFFNKGKQIDIIKENIGSKIIDLLYYKPIRIISHEICHNWEELKDQKKVIIKVLIQKHYNPYRIRNAPYKIKATFSNKNIFFIFFSKRTGYLRKAFPEAREMFISGKVDIYNDNFQITHPIAVNTKLDLSKKKMLIKPVYWQKKGLKSDFIKGRMDELLDILPNITEWNDTLFKHFLDIPTWKEALINIHKPSEENILDEKSTSILRLAYDELLAYQLSLGLVRNSFKKKIGNKYMLLDKNYYNTFIKSLPFELTKEQKEIQKEIIKDLLREERMNRLIHGDVGTGKTILALISAFYVIKSKYQVAILAPTELLATQHYELSLKIFSNFNISCALLVSSSKHKDKLINKIALGQIDLIIGTHSLIQHKVNFFNLSLVIIDEQHRFGVEQRLKIREKGSNVDMLLLSATPIPRTLMLAALGDISISTLKERPKNSDIKTILKSEDNLDEIINYLKNNISLGKKIFWVCPMIDSDEELEKSNVKQRYNSLKKIFKEMSILHGKMNSEEKKHVIRQFKKGFIKILITTVVIEVGVDIPDANIIVIEQSENFGLAQIHQLRGRVGRGKDNGLCILLFKKNLSELAYQRLMIMKSTNDGFIIAEKDLAIRGGGEILGIKQYGTENFIFFDIIKHKKLVEIANLEANEILKIDPKLRSNRGLLLRNLLYLFKKNEVLDLISAG